VSLQEQNEGEKQKWNTKVVDITYNQDGTSIVKEVSQWYQIPASIQNSHRIPTSAELVVGTKYESLFNGLTVEQEDRQTFVDEEIDGLLVTLSGGRYDKWDIDNVGLIRDAVKAVIVDKLHLMTDMEFYPYINVEDI